MRHRSFVCSITYRSVCKFVTFTGKFSYAIISFREVILRSMCFSFNALSDTLRSGANVPPNGSPYVAVLHRQDATLQLGKLIDDICRVTDDSDVTRSASQSCPIHVVMRYLLLRSHLT